jgi:MoaA/NifB/PqqE/SkfB family radical SAM enzyme
MLQIMLTDRCNQACPYCFAKDKLDAGAGTELSLEDLDFLIDLHRRWGLHHMSLAGGEPTMHSRFETVIERIQAADFPVVHLFTNGIVTSSRAEFLSRWPNLTILVNHNPPDTYTDEALQKVHHFIATCAKTCMRLSVGTTVYDPRPQLDFLLEAALKHGLSDIRIGLAHPIYHHGDVVNRFLSLDQCRQCAPQIVSLVERCAAHRIHVLFDCHFPLCMFTADHLQRLRDAQPDDPPPFAVDCCAQVTVRPDLRVFSCFSTGGVFNSWNLKQFATPDQLREAFADAFGVFQEASGYEECESCPAFGHSCCGGCLGQKLMAFPVPPEYVAAQIEPDIVTQQAFL